MTPVRSDIRSTSRRHIALVVLALLLAVLFAYPGSGLLFGWSSAEDGGIHRFHTVVWGVHTGLLLSVGLFALLLRTDERVATAQQVGVAMAVMMTMFFGSVVIPHFGESAVGIDRLVFSIMVLVLTGVVLALHPRRGELLTTGRRISKRMAAFGVIGLAVPSGRDARGASSHRSWTCPGEGRHSRVTHTQFVPAIKAIGPDRYGSPKERMMAVMSL